MERVRERDIIVLRSQGVGSVYISIPLHKLAIRL